MISAGLTGLRGSARSISSTAGGLAFSPAAGAGVAAGGVGGLPCGAAAGGGGPGNSGQATCPKAESANKKLSKPQITGQRIRAKNKPPPSVSSCDTRLSRMRGNSFLPTYRPTARRTNCLAQDRLADQMRNPPKQPQMGKIVPCCEHE